MKAHNNRLSPYLFLAVLVFQLVFCGFSEAQTTELNVTDFGARGDAIQIWVSTVNGSPLITVQATNQLSSADIGKLILLFGVGPATGPTTNQDLIATIVQVDSSGTNLTMSLPTGGTFDNVRAVYGTQNATAFQNCVNACNGTNTVITIPSGTFLLVPARQVTNYSSGSGVPAAVTLKKGGICFVGAGMTNTTLLGCGAWKLQGSSAVRGELFACQGPVTNNYPVVFDGLTMDGGVTNGNTSQSGFPANVIDGSGWDETHDAVVDCGSAPAHASKTFQNCQFIHWRGEMVKSTTSATNGFIVITNCVFSDGNASAINFSFSLSVENCTFSTCHQVMEFYQAYCSGPCYFRNNFITNMTAGGIAINGAVTNHAIPGFYITSNTFYESVGFVILTCPANNLYITGNQFFLTNGVTAIGLGCAGYQGTAINSNIVVAFNQFVNAYFVLQIMGGGANLTANALICSNLQSGSYNSFAYGYGWSTNIVFLNNTGGVLNSTILQGQLYLDDVSNHFPPYQQTDSTGKTNTITYTRGMRQTIHVSGTNSAWVIDDTQPAKIPPGAILQITSTNSRYAAPLYLSASMTGNPITLTNGEAIMANWNGSAWVTGSLPVSLPPPTNLRRIN